MNTTIHKSIKIGKNKYRAPKPKRRIAINVSQHLCVVQHKNRWIVALTHDEGWETRFFRANQTINRTQALKLISFLSDYVNLVKPTNATTAHAKIKVASNRIKNASTELLSIASENREGHI